MPDPITVEILRNTFNSIALEMNNNLARSAFSPIIYEMKDCSVALFNERAELLGQAPGLPIFLGALDEALRVTIDHVGIDGFQPGDVFIARTLNFRRPGTGSLYLLLSPPGPDDRPDSARPGVDYA